MDVVQGHPLLLVQKGGDGRRACIPYDMAKHVVKAAHDPDHPGIEGVANVRDQELVIQFKIETSLQLYIHNVRLRMSVSL
jgi:hypothetical protein